MHKRYIITLAIKQLILRPCQKRRNVIQKLLSIIDELVQIIENVRLQLFKYYEEDKVASMKIS